MDETPTLGVILGNLTRNKSKAKHNKAWNDFESFLDTGVATTNADTALRLRRKTRMLRHSLMVRSLRTWRPWRWRLRRLTRHAAVRRTTLVISITFGRRRASKPPPACGQHAADSTTIINKGLVKSSQNGLEWPMMSCMGRKCAKIFTRDEIIQGLQVKDVSPKWTLRKLCNCLGLPWRIVVLGEKSISERHWKGCRGSLDPIRAGKAAGWYQEDSIPCSGQQKHSAPLLCLEDDNLTSIPDKDANGLFHKTLKNGYGKKAPMGKNYLVKTGLWGCLVKADLGLKSRHESKAQLSTATHHSKRFERSWNILTGMKNNPGKMLVFSDERNFTVDAHINKMNNWYITKGYPNGPNIRRQIIIYSQGKDIWSRLI